SMASAVSRNSEGRRTYRPGGGRMRVGGAVLFSVPFALVSSFGFLKAERNSQCRFSPWTNSSLSITAWLMELTRLVLFSTWAWRLLVVLARLISVKSSCADREFKFVSADCKVPLAAESVPLA